MKVPWSIVDFGPQEKKAVYRVIKTGWLTQSRETELFEDELKKYLGASHAIVTNSGTSALIASLFVNGVSYGDEVIVPAYTFIATINSIIAVGAVPVLADCEYDTWNLSPKEAGKLITKKTKAIMPVDIAGMPIDVDGFRRLCKQYHLALIEDAAQAIGAQYNGQKTGSFGHTTVFSFHMAKVITTVEGGCVVTNDARIAESVRRIRNHGKSEMYQSRKHGTEYHYDGFGLNLRTNDILSAIGRVQLRKINKFLAHRHKLANFYRKNLANLCEFQKIPDYVSVHPNMIFPILVNNKKRDLINRKLFESGVGTRITWLPANKQKWHRNNFKQAKLPNTLEIASRVIAIPIGNKIRLSQAKYVVDVLKKLLK